MDGHKSYSVVLIILVIGAIALGGLCFISNSGLLSPSRSGYQAVFLVNNQVYFGKLSKENGQFPVLTDIYYLQVNQAIQPVQTKGQAATAANPEINLVKLGGELHGPTDAMSINRDQILLIEDLRADSNVVKAIDAYVAKEAAAPGAAN